MIDLKLQDGEKVLLSLRKHPLICVGLLIPYAILDYVPYLIPKVGVWLDSLHTSGAISYTTLFSFQNPWVDFIVGVYWLFLWMGAFGVFIDYFLDQWIVTDQRVIDINQKSFWSRDIITLNLSNVEDVETKIGGFFYTIFGFGTVSVESAGAEVGRMQMTGLSHPNEVRDLIVREMAKFRHGQQAPQPHL